MHVLIEMTGSTGLVMRNGAGADPENEFSVQIRDLIDEAKRGRMTADARHKREELEWLRGLYLQSQQIVVPTENIRKALIEGGRISKKGADIERAVYPLEAVVPLDFPDRDKSVTELLKDEQYHFRTVVNLNPTKGPKGGRGMTVRPIFPRWSLECVVLLDPEIMDRKTLESVVDVTGRSIGLCDARKIGKGRFTARITEVRD